MQIFATTIARFRRGRTLPQIALPRDCELLVNVHDRRRIVAAKGS